MQKPVQTPEQILVDLGIREPEDLDIEAIAEPCGATIRYRPLSGCEARIIGYHNRGVVDNGFREDMNSDIGCVTEDRLPLDATMGHMFGDGGRQTQKLGPIASRLIFFCLSLCFNHALDVCLSSSTVFKS
jgi:hypothetical protein